jgi:hypothetical protein
MSLFSDAELTYLAKGKLGRLATIDGTGMQYVVPLGWRYNPAWTRSTSAAGTSPGPGSFTTRSATRTSPSWSMTYCRVAVPGAC